MNIERLNKTQIVLLTLLVSFVTSIATGIVTVTLLEQAPPVVTQTINRVVERTVERVTPNKAQSGAAVNGKEVIVQKEDLVTETIAQNSKKLVRLYRMDPQVPNRQGAFLAAATPLSAEGLLVSEGAALPTNTVRAVTADGTAFTARTVLRDPDTSLALLAPIAPPEDTEAALPDFSPVTLSTEDARQLGESVVALSGSEQTSVAMGIIATLVQERPDSTESKNATSTTATSTKEDGGGASGDGSEGGGQDGRFVAIETNISARTVVPGSPLLDLFGSVIGINIGQNARADALYIPAHSVQALVQAYETREAQQATSTPVEQ